MRPGNQKGWILLDALIAVLILGIALTAVAATFTAVTRGTGSLSYRTRATYLAQEHLSNLRRFDGTGKTAVSPEWTTNIPNWRDPNNSGTDLNSPGMTFAIRTDVLTATETPAGLEQGIIPVRCTVSWTDADSTNQSLSVVTYYYQ